MEDEEGENENAFCYASFYSKTWKAAVAALLMLQLHAHYSKNNTQKMHA